jgi:hypothetical protein
MCGPGNKLAQKCNELGSVWRRAVGCRALHRGLFGVARAEAAYYRIFKKCPNRRIPALFATGVEILSRSFVAMLVGNHHGNGMPTKPLTRSTLPQPWQQSFAHDRRNDR